MNTTIQKLRAKLHEDKGVATIYFVIMTVAFLAIVGLVVDGAGKVQANQQAYNTADSAARAAANAVSGQAIINSTTAIDSSRAVTAANSYLSAAGVGGTVSVSGNRITVVVTTDYSPAFIPLAFPIEATATAELITQ